MQKLNSVDHHRSSLVRAEVPIAEIPHCRQCSPGIDPTEAHRSKSFRIIISGFMRPELRDGRRRIKK